MSDADPRWIPVFTAFDALRSQYESANFYANEEVCGNVANDTLLRRLAAAQLPGRAAKASVEWDEDYGPGEIIEPDADGKIPVPAHFWTSYLESDNLHRDADWLAGDFTFAAYDPMFKHGRGIVIGLEVDERHLPQITPRIAHGATNELGDQSGRAHAGGRSAAKWWPHFAEELAVYIHENGIPGGQGHDGQSAVIAAIFASMVEKGKPEPSRVMVQDVVNAVLRRIRSAGN